MSRSKTRLVALELAAGADPDAPRPTIVLTVEQRACALARIYDAARRSIYRSDDRPPPLPDWFLALPAGEQLARWQAAKERPDRCPLTAEERAAAWRDEDPRSHYRLTDYSGGPGEAPASGDDRPDLPPRRAGDAAADGGWF